MFTFLDVKLEKDVTVARETIAKLIGAEPNELFFMGCGTEGDNLALRELPMRIEKR